MQVKINVFSIGGVSIFGGLSIVGAIYLFPILFGRDVDNVSKKVLVDTNRQGQDTPNYEGGYRTTNPDDMYRGQRTPIAPYTAPPVEEDKPETDEEKEKRDILADFQKLVQNIENRTTPEFIKANYRVRRDRWKNASEEQNMAEAQTLYGFCFCFDIDDKKKDYKEAVEWFHKAADQHLAAAQYALGVCYASGNNGIDQNLSESVRWYREAANQGFVIAQYSLGNCYSRGSGVTQDYSEAMKWYRKAAEQGYAQAQFNLGKCYEDGLGVPKNLREALKWYRPAADQGHEGAKEAIVRIEKLLPLDLFDELIRSGFSKGIRDNKGVREINWWDCDLEYFVTYGNAKLKDKLSEAEKSLREAGIYEKEAAQGRINAVQKEIRAVQEEIAQKTYVVETNYSAPESDVKRYGDEDSFKMRIITGFLDRMVNRVDVTFPVSGVKVYTGKSNFVSGRVADIELFIIGSTGSCQELVRGSDKYRARVQFNNLRPYSSHDNRPAADVLNLDIVRAGE